MDDATIGTLGVLLLAISTIVALAARSIYLRGWWQWWRPTEGEINRRVTLWSYFFAIMLWPMFAVAELARRLVAFLKRLPP
jgi:hypothetical protein